MTELDVRQEEILQPLSGELVPAGDLPRVAAALRELRDYRVRLNDAVAAFAAAAVAESKRQGTRTLTAGAWTVEVGADTEIEWDVERLSDLLDAGLPQDRFDALVRPTVVYKVDGRVARQLESASEVYAEIIQAARGRVPKRQYVSVKNQ